MKLYKENITALLYGYKENIDRTSVKLMSHLRKIEKWQS